MAQNKRGCLKGSLDFFCIRTGTTGTTDTTEFTGTTEPTGTTMRHQVPLKLQDTVSASRNP